jgi:hypothetical protein
VQEKIARKTKTAEILSHVGAIPKLAAAVVPASHLEVRTAPEMVSSGIPQLDSLTGGFPRGCLTEICGTASSGRTSVLLVALARATQRGEVCALLDASDAFDPASAAAAGMDFSRLLWVRCGKEHAKVERRAYQANGSHQGMPSGISPASVNDSGFSRCGSISLDQTALFHGPHNKNSLWKNPELHRWESQLTQTLKVTDLLLQSNGFGMIALDLGDIPAQSARRIPLTSWFRFRRVIEHTPTVMVVLEQQPIAGSCASVLLKITSARSQSSDLRKKDLGEKNSAQADMAYPHPTHSELLEQFEITAELLRSRLERPPGKKPVQSMASFKSRAAWA